MRQTTIFDDTVASRIEALLARCDRIRKASDLTRPVVFDEGGERHARAIAAADSVPNRDGQTRGMGRFRELRS